MNKWIRGTNASVVSLAIIGIFIVATILLGSFKSLQWDLTKDKKFTLSEQTQDVLKELDKDIHVVVFSGGQIDPYYSSQISDLLKEYERRSHGKITLVEYDMMKQPSMAQQYNVDPGGSVIFESGEQKKDVPFYQMFVPGQSSYFFTGEEKFTEAIYTLTSTEKHPVYFLTGHGEIPFIELNMLRAALAGVNFEVKELNLYREGEIPADAKAVFLLGPQNDLDDKEAALIKNYIQGGGKLFLAFGFNKDMNEKWKNIDSLAAMLGVKNQHAIAIDPRAILGDPRTVVPEYGFHTIVNKLDEINLPTIIPMAISMIDDTNVTDYKPSMLLKTTNRAYGETDLELLSQLKIQQDEQDIMGPLNMAYAVKGSDDKPKAVIIGGSSFLSDTLIMAQGNRDFAMNSISWLNEQESQVTIRPRESDIAQQALIMPNQANVIFYGTIIVFPLLFVVIGGVIWSRRRKG